MVLLRFGSHAPICHSFHKLFFNISKFVIWNTQIRSFSSKKQYIAKTTKFQILSSSSHNKNPPRPNKSPLCWTRGGPQPVHLTPCEPLRPLNSESRRAPGAPSTRKENRIRGVFLTEFTEPFAAIRHGCGVKCSVVEALGVRCGCCCTVSLGWRRAQVLSEGCSTTMIRQDRICNDC
jgi:hypothetical protein